MKAKLIYRLALALVLAGLLLWSAPPGRTATGVVQAAARPAQEPVPIKVPTATIFVQTLITAGAPGGIVVAPACAEPAVQPLSSHASSLEDRLKEIVTFDPQYTVERRAGVVNLIARGRQSAPLLDIKVAHFEAKRVGSAAEALAMLLAAPEVKSRQPQTGARLFRGGLGYFDPANPTAAQSRSSRFDVACHNCSVLETLNAIARAQGQGVWVYKQIKCKPGQHYYSLDFLTP
ncbi:MAG TPA: hypothetical protein VF546_23890 [Pyrinomonadaceae bacterium]|jgi:hypothetical protein